MLNIFLSTFIISLLLNVLITGIKGLKGYPGDFDRNKIVIIKGEKGDFGDPGLPGLRGRSGAPGFKGTIGDKGMAGMPGHPGLPGLKGIQGDTGFIGFSGMPGPNGDPGIPGQKGVKGTRLKTMGYYFTRHSQNIHDPSCPNNSTPMWTGYSLLYIMGNEKYLEKN